MAVITFELLHGIEAKGSGDEPLLYREVGLRELTTADLIKAQLDAEKVVVQNGKAVAYTSDVMYGLNLLCRQVDYIGEIKGPLSLKMLEKLHVDDFSLLQLKATELDGALMEALAERGRSNSAG
ncbi:TPA: phage tail assembly protein [Aeromonas veronii]|uniref:phage tail assembly protein n=1 Tax=Aeromonas TaxID=642 RepID=UPI003310BF42|nr:phage tail assembly protein [Aeromonas veronii]HDO1332164.1 phage tail assembly protein [Aeromonas veronii]HDO1339081.1 phage tail assembly protein [Aeromonas veronii]HDO1341224.1 phage tail assembly protein [Aeromonas veronii]HDO1345798.1 phage tail assembly protein [Aeromonas veronii]